MPTGTDQRSALFDARSWWSIESEEVARLLDVDVAVGLSSESANTRLAQHGPNELAQRSGPSVVQRLVTQFVDPLVLLLLAAIVISVAAWIVENESAAPVEAIVIASIVLANAGIGVWQEGKATRAVDALQRLTATHTTVVRTGTSARVATATVVPGDVVLLAEGDVIGFDGRIVDAASIEVNEAALTGESVAVSKTPGCLDTETAVADRANMVFSGTAVVKGRCRAVVVATGPHTEVGRIATLLDGTATEPTPLQRQVQQLGRTLGLVVVALAGLVVGAIVVTSDVDTVSEGLDALLVAVSLAVAAVPEGLPAIITVVLALGVQRMSRHNAIVKRLLSVETLGSATVICTDKTGTLTRNEMTVTRVATASGEASMTGIGYSSEGSLQAPHHNVRHEVEQALLGASIACDATVELVGGTVAVAGDPTEISIKVALAKLGVELTGFARVDEIPFDSDRKLMSVVVMSRTASRLPLTSASGVVQYTKGAPDVLLDRCVGVYVAGRVEDLEQRQREAIANSVAAFANDGMRTLGVAGRPWRKNPSIFDETVEQSLIWLGLLGITDPPRTEAGDVIEQARSAGIRTMMLTGDHPQTAASIGSAVGIASSGTVVTGSQLDGLDWSDASDVRSTIESTDVFARVTPEHKLRLVEALQSNGNTVAMTGDGVNDAPALRRADIGVAMGGVGTDVAREASDMVLADDDFATILTAIAEGRHIFADIRKSVRYLLASNSGEVLVMVIGVLLAAPLGLNLDDGLAVPLLATQILWINLLTDSALALALGVDPSVEDVMDQPPRNLSDPIVDQPMWTTIAVVGCATALAGLVALDLELPAGLIDGDGDLVSARTMVFTTIVLAQVFNAFNARSDRVSAFVRVFDNRLLWASVAVTVALQVAVVHLHVLNRAFETSPLDLSQWVTCWALASSVLVANEIRKLAARRVRSRRPA